MTADVIECLQCSKLGELIGRVGDRWTLRVLISLRLAPLRFNTIRRAVPGISQQMLARTLRTLERDGMVTRTVYPSVPPQVEYALTDLGNALCDEGRRLGDWAVENLDEIERQRLRFDDRGEI